MNEKKDRMIKHVAVNGINNGTRLKNLLGRGMENNIKFDEIDYLNEKLTPEEKKILYTSASPDFNPEEELNKLREEEMNNNKLKEKYWADTDKTRELLKDSKIVADDNTIEYMLNTENYKKYFNNDLVIGEKLTGKYGTKNKVIDNILNNGGNFPLIFTQLPKFLDYYPELKQRLSNSIDSAFSNVNSSISDYFNLWKDGIIEQDILPSFTIKNIKNDLSTQYGRLNINRNRETTIYDYDNYSLYSQVHFAYYVINDNVHLYLKPNQKVFMIYDNLVFRITGKKEIDFHCIAGELDINTVHPKELTRGYYKNRNGNVYQHGYYGTGIVMNKQIAIITYEQYKLLRKTTKELFPSEDSFGERFIKNINESISCKYEQDIYNEVYLYTYNHSNYNKIDTAVYNKDLNGFRFKFSFNQYMINSQKSAFVRRNDGTYRCKRMDEVIHDSLNSKEYNANEIIESKKKKPIYSKRRGR